LLGYNPQKFQLKRGPLEAVGADIPYQEGHLAMRCNFATIDKNLTVIDRHVGRNYEGLDDITRYISEHVDIGVPYTFMRTYEHRAVLIIRHNLSDAITSNDPLIAGQKVRRISATNSDSLISAKLVQDFVDKAREVMEFHPANKKRKPPANYLLVREAGNTLQDLMPHFTEKWGVKKPVCIASNGVMKATCMLAGFSSVTIPEGDFKSDLDFIFENIQELQAEYDFVYAHVKKIDESGHDKDRQKKRRMIEMLDKRLEMLKKFDGILVLTSDHITSSIEGKHMPGPVPLLVYGKAKDAVKIFDEFSVKKGKLKNFTPMKLWKYVLG
jgi:2,3-bisphosphoglycerate-independent phosphoglycerate mutase